MITSCLRDARLRWSAHAARAPISARRNQQNRLKVNFFAGICVAAEDDDEAAPMAEGWLVREEFPQWLQPLETRLLDAMVSSTKSSTAVAKAARNRLRLSACQSGRSFFSARYKRLYTAASRIRF